MEKKMGFFEKLKKSLSKAGDGMLSAIFSGGDRVNGEFYEELEEAMIVADMGMDTAERLIEALREALDEKDIKTRDEARNELRRIVADEMRPDTEFAADNGEAVLLIVGVNGVGKTTSIGKLAAYQPTGRQRFHLCCKWQATAQSRYKRLIYQGIGSMQYHVAITAFHLHHPAFQLIATAGSMTRTARKAYRHHSRYTYLYHNKHQLHKFRSIMGRIRLPLPHRVEVRTHHQSSWYHLFPSAQNHVRR